MMHGWTDGWMHETGTGMMWGGGVLWLLVLLVLVLAIVALVKYLRS